MENTNQTAPVQDICGPEEIAVMLGVHERTVRRLLVTGQIPGRKLGRQWRCSRKAVAELFGKA